MKRQPLVSIITPSYNQGEFIEDAILAVKNQEYSNIEHIIIDGASNDNTLEIIKKYEGTYNLRWLSEPDNGIFEATNKGLTMAQGEIRGHIAADDLYLPWTVSVAVEYFNRHPTVEFVYGDMLGMNLETGRNWLAFKPKFNLLFLRSRVPSTTAAAFFRRSVVDKLGLYNENLRFDAEHEYCIKVAKHCKVSKIEEVLYVDRVQPKGLRATTGQQLSKEREFLEQSYVPKGMRGYLFKVGDSVFSSIVKKLLRLKFAYYYLTRNRLLPSKDRPAYPWKNFIESSGIQNISWFTILATAIPGAHYFKFILKILPWARRRYKGSWFVYNTAETCIKNEDRGEDN